MPSIRAAGSTHVGLVRKRNEDSYYVGEFLFAVADGLGGHVAGDIASQTAITAFRSYDQPVGADELPNHLGAAVNAVSTAIQQRIAAQPALAGMGTTLVALLRSGDSTVLANVGDSRAYLLHDRGSASARTLQISEDHVYSRLVSGAAIVPLLPEKLALFLDGRLDGRSPDLRPFNASAGDRIMLCSDGLSSYVPHQLIHAILNREPEPAVAVDRLIGVALEHGGHDNVTVVIVDF
jgi:serine/threonine protein phosphatase PrpC